MTVLSTSVLTILPVNGTKWLVRPAFLFTCSYLLAVAQDSVYYPLQNELQASAKHTFTPFPALITANI